MTSSERQLTPKQQRALNIIETQEVTTEQLADELKVSESTARDHLSGIRKAGIPLYREDGVIRVVTGHPTNENATIPGSKARITREANEWLVEKKEWLNEVLSNTAPAVADGGIVTEAGNEDVVIHRTDDHIGEYRVDEFGNVVFDENIAETRIRNVFDRSIDLLERQQAAGSQIDTVHVLLGGDIVTGEGIYNGQPWETCLTLDKQVELAADLYFEQIATLANRFETVQVITQPGNHGELRVDARSNNANADIIMYGQLDAMVRVSDLTNVTFIRNESTKFTNFEMRGHRGHLRHGNGMLQHIGTSSSENKWKGWLIRHGFDIGYRGHFHHWKIEPVANRPVIMSGSICPPGDFEESLSVWNEPAGTIHGVSDDRALTWFYPLYFDGREEVHDSE